MIDLSEITLSRGAHASPSEGLCAMEAVAYIAGEPHSDHPECACPVIATFLRNWNDSLGDADRNRLVRPLIPRVVGTRSTAEVEERRRWMSLDWLVRVHTPAFLRLTPALVVHANALESLPSIEGNLSEDAIAALFAARDAAGDAARNAARNAAGDAARNAAVYAAWNAAWNAAGDAARNAAGYAAWNAAGYAAWNAAGDAARNAAWEATVEQLQASAIELVERMIGVLSPKNTLP